MSSVSVQFEWVLEHSKANIVYYQVYLFQSNISTGHCVTSQIVWNSQTLEQFFEPLYILRHCQLVYCWISGRYYSIWCKLIPQCCGQLMGSGCASILVPSSDHIFSFIIQCENYFCRDKMMTIIGATVSWDWNFKTLSLKYCRLWYVHIVKCKSVGIL
jgi:hypothetical protein